MNFFVPESCFGRESHQGSSGSESWLVSFESDNFDRSIKEFNKLGSWTPSTGRACKKVRGVQLEYTPWFVPFGSKSGVCRKSCTNPSNNLLTHTEVSYALSDARIVSLTISSLLIVNVINVRRFWVWVGIEEELRSDWWEGLTAWNTASTVQNSLDTYPAVQENFKQPPRFPKWCAQESLKDQIVNIG